MVNNIQASSLDPLLEILEAKLRERGVRASLWVVGGAAIMKANLPDSNRVVTTDVDVQVSIDDDDRESFWEAVDEAGREFNLSPDWMNDDFKGNSPREAKPHGASPLLVEFATPEELFAMKALSLRIKDQDDLRSLVRGMSLSKRGMAHLLRNVWGDKLDAQLYKSGLGTIEDAVNLVRSRTLDETRWDEVLPAWRKGYHINDWGEEKPCRATKQVCRFINNSE